MISSLTAVVPVKSGDHAKSRLRDVLTERQRRDLSKRLLKDTLDVLQQSSVERICVVTDNREVAKQAKKQGADVVSEPSGPSGARGRLNAALEEGRRVAVGDGAKALLTLPIDLILLPSFDLDATFARIQEMIDKEQEQPPSVFLETDDNSDGTNFLLQTPPRAVDFLYGPGSLRAHESNAIARGHRFRELDEPALRWDVDEADDTKRWARALTAGTEQSGELETRIRKVLEVGTALPFLLDTDWATPLREALES